MVMSSDPIGSRTGERDLTPAEVFCPHCGAEPGDRCVLPDGRYVPGFHGKRTLLADEEAKRLCGTGVHRRLGYDEHGARCWCGDFRFPDHPDLDPISVDAPVNLPNTAEASCG